MNIDQIRSHAQEFRAAIEQMEISEFPGSSFFESFPSGCCSDTSELFAKYLSENGVKVEYVCGINECGQSHAWIELENYIIDLTADQFTDVSSKITITQERIWHTQFMIEERRIADFESINDFNSRRLRLIYDNILKKI